MDALLPLGLLRHLRLGLGNLFGRRPGAHRAVLRAVERAAAPPVPRSVIAAFEQGGAQRHAARRGVVKLAIVRSAAPVAPTPIPRPIASGGPVVDKASTNVVHLADVRTPASRPRRPSSISAA